HLDDHGQHHHRPQQLRVRRERRRRQHQLDGDWRNDAGAGNGHAHRCRWLARARVVGPAYAGGGSSTIPPPDGGSAGGGTVLLSASTQITPGPHALYLSIFDQGDQILDSAVFLDNLRIGFVPDPAMNCKPGATPVLFSMTLDPATAENPAGTTHTVTATLRDGDGNLVPNAPISFTVMGANTASGISMTDAGGQAQFTYTGNNLGADVIAACFDFDGNGSCEAQASAT